MNKDLPGFDKSAPTNRPLTRGQQPVSAWDVDLSPFHRLVESQLANTQQITDTFTHKMEEILAIWRDEKRQEEKRLQTVQDKIAQHYKNQSKSNADICTGISEIVEQIGKVHQFLQDTSERLWQNVQNYNSRKIPQESHVRESLPAVEILQPLEKLVILEEDSLHHLQTLLHMSQEWRSFRELTQQQYTIFVEKIADCERKIEDIENLLIALGASLQKYLPDKNQFKDRLLQQPIEQVKLLEEIHLTCNRIVQVLEGQTNFQQHLEKLCQLTQESLEKQKEERCRRRRENVMFSVFMVLALLIFAGMLVTGIP